MTSEVTVGIVTYNSAQHLPACLSALRRQTSAEYRLVVVDNGSTDDTLRVLKRLAPEAEVHALPENRGHSAGCNILFETVRGGFLILLDHDAIPAPTWLAELAAAARRLRTPALLTARVSDNTPDVPVHDGSSLHFLGLGTYNAPVESAEPVPVAIAATTSLLIPRNAIGDVRFDEDFFIYHNDVDFVYRLRILGMPCYAVPTALVEHGTGTSSLSARQSQSYSAKRFFYVVRNHWLFITKNFAVRTLAVIAPALLLYEIALLLYGLGHGYLRSWLSVWWWLIRHTPETMQKRRLIQGRRQLRDVSFLSAHRLTLAGSVQSAVAVHTVTGLLSLVFRGYWFLARRFL